jgi:hypothetical protein
MTTKQRHIVWLLGTALFNVAVVLGYYLHG